MLWKLADVTTSSDKMRILRLVRVTYFVMISTYAGICTPTTYPFIPGIGRSILQVQPLPLPQIEVRQTRQKPPTGRSFLTSSSLPSSTLIHHRKDIIHPPSRPIGLHRERATPFAGLNRIAHVKRDCDLNGQEFI